MDTALVIVDIQNEYFPGGKRELEGPQQAAECARGLLDYFRRAQMPVVFIQHINPEPNATAFVKGSQGAQVHATIAPLASEAVFEKHYPNSFRETPLLEHLHQLGITRLVICGMMTHMCVEATTRAAFDFGFKCLVAADACATKALAFGGVTVPADHVHRAFLAGLNGTYAEVMGADQIVARLRDGH